jgi:hypothetical protein
MKMMMIDFPPTLSPSAFIGDLFRSARDSGYKLAGMTRVEPAGMTLVGAARMRLDGTVGTAITVLTVR